MATTTYYIHNEIGTYRTNDPESAELHSKHGFKVTAVTHS